VPDDYATIQEAINAASAGDTIYVKTGTYYESVVVNKTVSLVGESRDNTILNGTSPDSEVIVEAGNVEISNFTFTGWLGNIWVNATTDVTIVDSTIIFNVIGVYAKNSRNVTVENNILAGTLLNSQGILLDNSTECNVINNTITGALYEGVRLWYSSSNVIRGNNITNNDDGIFLIESSQNSILDNVISDNAGPGIYFDDVGDSNNTIVHNNFVDNLVPQAYFYDNSSPNVWDDGYPSGGNYWSDYKGTDLYSGPYQNVTGSDGIGDTPYVIDANNTDHYPLMGMFYIYSLSQVESLTAISNSTVTSFQADVFSTNHGIIVFNIFLYVTCEQGSTGFCRVSIPTAAMKGTYHVLPAEQITVNGNPVWVDVGESPYTLLPCSNADISYLYFTYPNPTVFFHIMPEFPSFLILAMFMSATPFAMAIHKKRHSRS
jgi:parallel beta-helix repeat protein